jgi:hypothetical protein
MITTQRLLSYADGVDSLGRNTNTKYHEKQHRTLKEFGLQRNARTTTYNSCLINITAGKIIASTVTKSSEKFKYLGRTKTSQNDIRDYLKSKLNGEMPPIFLRPK